MTTDEPSESEKPAFEASFHPPAIARPLAVGASLAAIAASGAIAYVTLRFTLWSPLPGLGEWDDLFGGLACSAMPLLVVAMHLWVAELLLACVWLRVTPGRVEWERVWWGVRRFGVAEARPGDGLLDQDGAWFKTSGISIVTAVLNGQKVQLTPPLTGERAAPVRAALAEAIGTVPAGRAVGPWLAPADPQAPPHPAVRVGRDRRGRVTVTTRLRPDRLVDRLRCLGLGLPIASAVPVLWAWLPPSAPNTWAADLVLGSVGVLAGGAAGLTIAAAPWATVRVAVGTRRISVRTGWGPMRIGRSVAIDSVCAAVVAAHHTGVWAAANGADPSPRGAPWSAITRNPVAALVRPRRRRDRWIEITRTFLPLTGRFPSDDPTERTAFAAAAAGAVASAMVGTGWTPDVPDDWRFAPSVAPTISA